MPHPTDGGRSKSLEGAEASPRPSQPETVRQEDHTSRMRRLAREKLDQLFQEAVSVRFYGRIMIEVSFENGRPVVIHRRIEGVDK